MALIFRRVYMLTNPSQNYLPELEQIVLGARKRDDHDGAGEWKSSWQFLTTGDSGRVFFGEALDVGDGVVEIVDSDADRKSGDGLPIVWGFTPLTLALWRPTVDPEKLELPRLRVLRTDLALQEFYLGEYLYDWWKE